MRSTIIANCNSRGYPARPVRSRSRMARAGGRSSRSGTGSASLRRQFGRSRSVPGRLTAIALAGEVVGLHQHQRGTAWRRARHAPRPAGRRPPGPRRQHGLQSAPCRSPGPARSAAQRRRVEQAERGALVDVGALPPAGEGRQVVRGSAGDRLRRVARGRPEAGRRRARTTARGRTARPRSPPAPGGCPRGTVPRSSPTTRQRARCALQRQLAEQVVAADRRHRRRPPRARRRASRTAAPAPSRGRCAAPRRGACWRRAGRRRPR